MQRLILLDGHALLFRAYHAMPPFTAPDGRPTGAVYGFANVLIRVLRELTPRWLMACFDAPGPTFRDDMYPAYKATRAETPLDIITQEPMTKQVLEAFGVPHTAISGFEADDLIGTLVKQALSRSEIQEIIVVTGDRDLLQLSQPKVKIYLLRNGTKEIVLLDKQAVTDLIGLPPTELLDWKALRGDPSDNIVGLPGIGDKTALELIRKFTSLENLYKWVTTPENKKETPEGFVKASQDSRSASPNTNRDKFKIRDSVFSALLAHRDRAFQNRELLRLRYDAPVELNLDAADQRHYHRERAAKVLGDLGFKTIVSRLPASPDQPTQPHLFS